MALNLMYITNRSEVAAIAEEAGVDRIFVDMEYIGKDRRQGGMDTVQNRHTLQDVQRIRKVLQTAQLLVRVNPIHDATDAYMSSEQEIDEVIQNGADIVMLPYFKTCEEVRRFVSIVNGRARTCLLVETAQAVEHIEDILAIDGIDEIHIGLNDLSLEYEKGFMFELLADGTVDRLCAILAQKRVVFGFGGIASLGKGLIRSEHIIMEHYRLGSSMVILSRSFCNTEKMTDVEQIRSVFSKGVKAIREYEAYCEEHSELWEENREETATLINAVASQLRV